MFNIIKKVVLLLSLIVIASCSESKIDKNVSNSSPKQEESPVVSTAKPIPSMEVVNFDFDRSAVREVDKAKLDAQAEKIKKENITKITIEGHTDYLGTKEYNLALGERRANATKKYLVSKGVNAKYITIVSYGKDRPIDSGENAEARAKNRRTVTVFGK